MVGYFSIMIKQTYPNTTKIVNSTHVGDLLPRTLGFFLGVKYRVPIFAHVTAYRQNIGVGRGRAQNVRVFHHLVDSLAVAKI